MKDCEIIRLYFERNEQAILETEKKYEKFLMKIAYNILANNEDCRESTNDTYLAAWNSIPPNCPENLSTYLAKLIRRISIDIFRKRKSEKRAGGEYAISLSELSELSDIKSPESVEDAVFTELLAKKISDFLRTLSHTERCAFLGRYYFCDSLKQISRYLSISESKLKSMLFRIRLRLKDYLEKEGFDI